MTHTVRRVSAGEGGLLRSVRLAALADSPGAFSSTHADEAAFDDDVWDERAARGADDESGMATFLLEQPGSAAPTGPVGIAVGHRPGPDPRRVELVSMWVRPTHRRTGAGRALVEAVATWAAATGATHLELWVMRTNPGAQVFYERLGFTATDADEVPADHRCHDQLRMTRPLAPA